MSSARWVSYHTIRNMRRHDCTVADLGQEGSGRNPTDLMMIKQRWLPCSWRSSTSITASHHRFSIRGTVTKLWTVDGALSWELWIYQTRRTQYMHNLLECEANPLEYIHEYYSVSMLAAGMIYQYLADVVPPPDSRTGPKLYVWSLIGSGDGVVDKS
jgi:hypothetical protein